MGGDQLEPYLPHVYRYSAYMLRDHHVAQDVTQETMLRALKQQRSFDNPKAWLLKVAANLCRDHLRRRRSSLRHPETLLEETVGDVPEPWFQMLQRESCGELERVVRELSSREQSVLYLSAFEEMSNGDIATVLDMSSGAVKVALSRARQSVRKAIQSGAERGISK